MLESLGYTVSACSNGEEAVEFYRHSWKKVDLVIVDMIMPTMDGEQTFAVMRTINPEAVVLITSGYSLDGKAQNMITRGAKGFIQKPYRMGELSAKIVEVLKKG